MKIGMNEIICSIEHTAIQKISNELLRKGFVVNSKKTFLTDTKMSFDLYAEKGEDKRIYELKIGKNKIRKSDFEKLQKEARRLGAKLYIIYLEVPRSKEIEFEGLEQIIYEDLISDFPSEIDSLSTHSTIVDVSDIEIDSINISNEIAKLNGSGKMYIHLQFGSRSDFRNGDAIEDDISADFFFKLSIDIPSNKIIKHYYKIDTEQ